MPATLFDLALTLAMVLAAFGALWSRDLFRSVVLFVVFGLLVSLAWVRLEAPDVALAEAAIGAGLSGALLLDAVGHLRRRDARTSSLDSSRSSSRPSSPNTPRRTIAAAALGIPVVLLLLAAIANREPPAEQLAARVQAALPESGVDHAITAVLLQFRSYDTLLEIAVLLVAAVVALALRQESHPATPSAGPPIRTPLLASVLRLLLPVMLVVAAYLLWVGATQPGGAFQAGAVLAALGVAWRVAGNPLGQRLPSTLTHAALLMGFAAFLVAAAGMLLLGRPLLGWPRVHAKSIILAIETLLTISIGATLLGLFASTPPPRGTAS